MFPTSHIWTATVQILASSTLTEVEDIFSEETMAICDTVRLSPTCTRNSPTVSSVRAMVPEKHASMTTTLEHLKSHKMPPCTNMPSGVAGAPSVQAIIVNGISIVNPELASIIRDNLEVVVTCPEDSESASPTHSEVIASMESRPFSTRVAIVHILARFSVSIRCWSIYS